MIDYFQQKNSIKMTSKTYEFFFDTLESPNLRYRGIVKTCLYSGYPDFSKVKEDIRNAVEKSFDEKMRLYSFRELNCVFQDDEDCYDFSIEMNLNEYVKKEQRTVVVFDSLCDIYNYRI